MHSAIRLAISAAAAIIVGSGFAHGDVIDSAGSGYWANPASWNLARLPACSDDVTIRTDHTITIDTNTAFAIRSLRIQTNGVLTHLVNGTTAQGERYKVVLNVSDHLTIDLGGQINVDGKGYGLDGGPGRGATQIGASHGGDGQWLTAGKGSVNDGHNEHWVFPRADGTMILVR